MITATAPVRLSLAGGGSDLPEYYRRHGCELLCAALDRHVEVGVEHLPAGAVVVEDTETSRVGCVRDLPSSLVRCGLERFQVTTGVRVTVRSSCPPGSGLGWSGALTVALVTALGSHLQRPVRPAVAARIGFQLERHDLGRVVGQQDQWAAALGGVVRLVIDRAGRSTGSREPELESCLEGLLDRAVLLFRTPIRHSSSDVLAAQVRRLAGGGAPRVAAETGMREIAAMVGPFERALRRRDVTALGSLLHRHWLTKVRVSPAATAPRIDRWYELARAAGAYGGKVVGAGGGGHLLLVCSPDRSDEVADALGRAGLERVALRLDRSGVRLRRSGGGQPEAPA